MKVIKTLFIATFIFTVLFLEAHLYPTIPWTPWVWEEEIRLFKLNCKPYYPICKLRVHLGSHNLSIIMKGQRWEGDENLYIGFENEEGERTWEKEK